MTKDEIRNWIIFGGASVVLTLGALVLALGPGLRWATDTAVDALPLEFEANIGLSVVDSAMFRRALSDPERQAVLDRVAKLLPDAGDPRTYRIAVLRDTTVNAFALPGGQLVIHTGLLALLRDESELFGVLGHEAGHVRRRHALKQIGRQLGLAAGIALILGDQGGLAGLMARTGGDLVQLGHGRREEEAADDEGLATLRRLHLDPDGMVRVLETLERTAGSAGRIPEFISTHPAPARRIARIREELKALPAAPRERVLSEAEWHALTHDLAGPSPVPR